MSKSRPKRSAIIVLQAAVLASFTLRGSYATAATVTKAATGTDLAAGASWTGGVAPTSTDVADFETTSLGGTLTLGSAANWGELYDNGGTAAISLSGSTLTLTGGQSAGGTANSGLYISTAGVNLTASNNVVLGSAGTQAWTVVSGDTATFSGIIAGSGTGSGITKAGAGTLVLTGANTFGGGLIDNGGVVSINNGSALGTGTFTFNSTSSNGFVISSPAAVALTNNIALSATAGTYTFYKTAASSSTGNQVALSGNITGGGAGVVLEFYSNTSGDFSTTYLLSGSNSFATGTNLFVVRGGLVVGNSAALSGSSVTLQTNVNSTAGNLQFATSGTFNDAVKINTSGDTIGVQGTNSAVLGGGISGAAPLVKVGTGTLTLATTASTYTGVTTVSAGTLLIDAGGSVPSASVLTTGTTAFNGGSGFGLTVANAAGQTFASTTLLAGQSAFTNAGSGMLALNAITVPAGATADFASSGSGTITTTNTNTNGILGGYATANGGTAFATVNASGAIISYAGTGNNTATLGNTNATAAYANVNVDVDSGVTLDSAIAPNSIRFSGTAANTLTLTGANSIASGGILDSPTVGANTSTITGGTLSGPAAGGTLIVQQYDTTGALSIGSVIANGTAATSLLKSGAGNLFLTATDTYTGATTVNGGTLTLAAAPNGTPSITVNAGATLALATASAVGQSSGKGAVTINSGGTVTTAIDAATGKNDAYAYFANTLTMNGGTLAQSASYYGNTYGFNVGVTATSDAFGTPSLISATSALNTASTAFVVTRGSASPASDLNVTGVIIGGSTFGLVKSGTGILTLSVINTYTGTTTVTAGTLVLANGGTSGAIRSPLIVNGGAVNANSSDALGYGSTTSVPTLTVNSGGVFNIGLNGNEGYLTNLVLAGGSVTSTGGGAFFFTGYGITSSGATASTVLAPISVRGAGLTVAPTAGVASGADLTLSGVISYGTGGSGNLTMNGSGVLALSGQNTFTGNVVVSSGTLNASLNNGSSATTSALGALGVAGRTVTVASGATLAFTTTNVLGNGVFTTVRPTIVLNGGTATTTTAGFNILGDVQLNGGTLTSATTGSSNYGAYALNTGATAVTVGGSAVSTITGVAGGFTNLGAATTFNVADATGSIASDLNVTSNLTNRSADSGGSGSVIKTGVGTMALSGASVYTGGTTITGGTLQANNTTGSATGAGLVTVGDGTNAGSGVLAGTGTISNGSTTTNNVTVANGGTITAGTGATAADTVGTLHTGSETWSAGGTYAAKVGTVGGSLVSDQLIMSGLTPATSGFTIQITGLSSGAAPTIGQSFRIADVTTATSAFSQAFLSQFTLVTTGSAAGQTFTLSSQADPTDGGFDIEANDVSPTPEPTSAVLLGLTVVPLLTERRRRNRQA